MTFSSNAYEYMIDTCKLTCKICEDVKAIKFIYLWSISTIRETFTSNFPFQHGFGKKTSEINVFYTHFHFDCRNSRDYIDS